MVGRWQWKVRVGLGSGEMWVYSTGPAEGGSGHVSFQRTLETEWRMGWITDLVPAEKLTERMLRVAMVLAYPVAHPLTLERCQAHKGELVTVC